MINPRGMSREEMLAALERLGEVLYERGVDGQLYVVGGAAVIFAYRRDGLSRDIDAIVVPEEEVFAAARQVGSELALPEDWLNDTARGFLPGVNTNEGAVVVDRPGIQVRAAPADVVLAMKLLASRGKDMDDIDMLAGKLGLKDADAVWAVFSGFYPRDAFGEDKLWLPEERDRARFTVEQLFGELTPPDDADEVEGR